MKNTIKKVVKFYNKYFAPIVNIISNIILPILTELTFFKNIIIKEVVLITNSEFTLNNMKLNLKKVVKFYNKYIFPPVKFLTKIILPLVTLYGLIRNTQLYIWIWRLFRWYMIIFALLGSIIMAIPGMTLVDYSNLVGNNLDSFWIIIKSAYNRLTSWLKRKIFGFDPEDILASNPDNLKDRKFSLDELKEILKDLPKKEQGGEVIENLRKTYIHSNPAPLSWSEYLWDSFTNPYVLTGIALVAAGSGFWYFYPDQFNTCATSIVTAVSTALFGSKPEGDSSADDQIIEPSSSKSQGKKRANFANPFMDFVTGRNSEGENSSFLQKLVKSLPYNNEVAVEYDTETGTIKQEISLTDATEKPKSPETEVWNEEFLRQQDDKTSAKSSGSNITSGNSESANTQTSANKGNLRIETVSIQPLNTNNPFLPPQSLGKLGEKLPSQSLGKLGEKL
jgi:hypothetical protein